MKRCCENNILFFCLQCYCLKYRYFNFLGFITFDTFNEFVIKTLSPISSLQRIWMCCRLTVNRLIGGYLFFS